MTQAYTDLIKSFANHVGLDAEALAKTEEIVIDGLKVGLQYEGDEDMGDIVYFANLGAPADHRIAEVYKTLLHANNLWAGTGGATLGLQPETGSIILAGRIDFNGVSAASLAMLLDAYADTALHWKKYIADQLEEHAEMPSPAFLRA